MRPPATSPQQTICCDSQRKTEQRRTQKTTATMNRIAAHRTWRARCSLLEKTILHSPKPLHWNVFAGVVRYRFAAAAAAPLALDPGPPPDAAARTAPWSSRSSLRSSSLVLFAVVPVTLLELPASIPWRALEWMECKKGSGRIACGCAFRQGMLSKARRGRNSGKTTTKFDIRSHASLPRSRVPSLSLRPAARARTSSHPPRSRWSGLLRSAARRDVPSSLAGALLRAGAKFQSSFHPKARILHILLVRPSLAQGCDPRSSGTRLPPGPPNQLARIRMHPPLSAMQSVFLSTYICTRQGQASVFP